MKATKKGSRRRAGSEPAAEPMPGLYDMGEAIAALKTSRPTFYRWVRAGRIRGVKVGRQWRFEKAEIERFLKGGEPRIELQADPGPLIAGLEQQVRAAGGTPAERAHEEPMAAAADAMIRLAIAREASDLHITPHRFAGAEAVTGVVRLRVDGVMHVAAEFDGRLVGPLMQQWKRMAACNVQETQRPQDGRILARLAGKPGRVLDLRASFVPAAIGESVTVRLLDSSRVQLDLGAIALAPRVRERIEAALGRPWGVVLFTGPTGSGKTTVAYAALHRLAGPQVKVMSVEDPVEYLLPWVTQIPLRRDAGLTYEAAIRSILRSDPDVVYVAETTGAEVLAGVLSAALTGHLVLTTMHVDRAASALARMAELGAEPLAVAQATRLVLAQRLVRRLCPACAKPANLPVETVARARQMAAEGGLPPAEFGDAFRAAVGCPKCAGTGYRGRFAIMEALAPCAGLNEALQRRATAGEIERVAIAGGMVTLAADGLRRAAAGETTIEEALRVLGLPPSGARPAGGG